MIRRLPAGMIGILFLLCLPPGAAPARGQAVSAADTPSAPTGAPQSFQLITDVFVGRNTVGPYALTWKGLDPLDVRVSRDGFRLASGLDYALDNAQGILTFTAPLRSGQIARADYLCEPGKATRNTGIPVIPLDFKLFEGAAGALSLNALYRPPDPKTAAAGESGLMLLGLTGQSRLARGSSLTSKLFFDTRGGSTLDRSGIQLGESTNTSFGKFGLGFARAGREFAAGKETGIAAGQQTLEATGALNPIYGIAASASFRQTVDLPAAGNGATVNVLGERLAGILFGQLRFQATHTDTTTDSGDGSTSTRTADRLQLDQKLGDRTQASALVERNKTGSPDGTTVAQTSTLQIRTRPTDSVTVVGGYKNALLPSGAQDSTSLRVDAEATRQLKLGVAVADQFGPTKSTHSREATFEYVPSTRYSLGGSLAVKADGGDRSLIRGINATARPSRYLEVSGRVRLRNECLDGTPDLATPDSYDLKLALNVFHNAVRLTGGFSDNPEDDKGLVSRAYSRNVGVQSTWGPVDLAGAYSLQNDYLSMRVSTIMDLKLGWRFGRASSLVTSFREALTQDAGLTAADTYSLSLTHKVGSLFDLALSGMMTTYEKDGVPQPNSDYRAEAKLGVRF